MTFLTAPAEGTAQAVMKGNTFVRFIMPMKRHFLNEPSDPEYTTLQPLWEVLPSKREEPSKGFWGFHWVGLYPIFTIYKYQFRWTEWTQPQQTTVNEPKGRDEMTHFIFTKSFTYYSKVTDVKTNSAISGEELIPLDVEYTITVRCTNPYLALFKTDDWLAFVFSVTNNVVRNYVGRRTYADLASELDRQKNRKGQGVSEEFDAERRGEILETANDSLNSQMLIQNERVSGGGYKSGLKHTCGITIDSAEIISISFGAGVSQQLKDATTAKYVAEQEAKSIIAKSEAEKQKVINETDAQVYHIDETNKALERGGDRALAYKYMETLAQAGSRGSAIIVTHSPGEISTDTLVRSAMERQTHARSGEPVPAGQNPPQNNP
jgi:regulator of protease activity HflC (stomatin/prohibitin superfamily)